MTSTSNLRVVVGCKVFQSTLVDLKATWYITKVHKSGSDFTGLCITVYVSVSVSLYDDDYKISLLYF